jgi:predicted DNA-binding protein
MKVMIYGFYTDKETKEALKKAAKETGRPKAHILNEGLKKELEAIEKGKK